MSYTVEKTCPICKNVFIGRPPRKFCSLRCFGAWNIEQRMIRQEESRTIPLESPSTKSKRHYRKNRERLLEKDKYLREEVVDLLGGSCVSCGYEEDVRALQLDHIRSDGAEDRKRLGNKISRYYVNHPVEALLTLQVLCANCNKIKAITANEYNRTRRLK